MIDQRRARVCLVVILIVATTGAIDAALGRVWDLLVLLVIVTGLAGIALVPSGADRSVVSVRRDLARWLHRRSSIEGESVERITDRAIATYRSQWSPSSDALP